MARRRAMITRSGSLEGIVSDAISAIEDLHGEMQEWQDNLSSNNMEHLPKYDEVSEAVDALDNIINNSLDIPELLPNMQEVYEWQELAPYKGAQSRSNRANTASSEIERVIDFIQEAIENLEDEKHADLVSEWETYKDDLQNIVDEIGSVSFPGMY